MPVIRNHRGSANWWVRTSPYYFYFCGFFLYILIFLKSDLSLTAIKMSPKCRAHNEIWWWGKNEVGGKKFFNAYAFLQNFFVLLRNFAFAHKSCSFPKESLHSLGKLLRSLTKLYCKISPGSTIPLQGNAKVNTNLNFLGESNTFARERKQTQNFSLLRKNVFWGMSWGSTNICKRMQNVLEECITFVRECKHFASEHIFFGKSNTFASNHKISQGNAILMQVNAKFLRKHNTFARKCRIIENKK